MTYKVIPRSRIPLLPKPKRAVYRFFVHCSASDAQGTNYVGTAFAREIHRWHLQRWRSGLGYHFLIDASGDLVTGRDLERNPVAQKGHNTSTLAVCVHGLTEDRFHQAQMDTLVALCRHYTHLYEGDLTFHGHTEVSAKSCPVFDYKKVLNLDTKGYMR